MLKKLEVGALCNSVIALGGNYVRNLPAIMQAGFEVIVNMESKAMAELQKILKNAPNLVAGKAEEYRAVLTQNFDVVANKIAAFVEACNNADHAAIGIAGAALVAAITVIIVSKSCRRGCKRPSPDIAGFIEDTKDVITETEVQKIEISSENSAAGQAKEKDQANGEKASDNTEDEIVDGPKAEDSAADPAADQAKHDKVEDKVEDQAKAQAKDDKAGDLAANQAKDDKVEDQAETHTKDDKVEDSAANQAKDELKDDNKIVEEDKEMKDYSIVDHHTGEPDDSQSTVADVPNEMTSSSPDDKKKKKKFETTWKSHGIDREVPVQQAVQPSRSIEIETNTSRRDALASQPSKSSERGRTGPKSTKHGRTGSKSSERGRTGPKSTKHGRTGSKSSERGRTGPKSTKHGRMGSEPKRAKLESPPERKSQSSTTRSSQRPSDSCGSDQEISYDYPQPSHETESKTLEDTQTQRGCASEDENGVIEIL